MQRNQQTDAPTKIQPATALKRMGAIIIDVIFLALLIFISKKVFEIDRFLPWTEQTKFIALIGYFYLLLTILPHVVFAQTIGKYNTGIKVVDNEYERVSIATLFLRDLFLRPLVLVAPFTALGGDGRALHDKILGTQVVEAKYRLKSSWLKDIFFYFYHFVVLALTLVLLICVREPKAITDPDIFIAELTKFLPKNEYLNAFGKKKGTSDNVEAPVTNILKIKGKVLVSYPWAKVPKAPTEGVEMRPQGTIVTHDQSSALISFKDKYSWQLRVSPNSDISNNTLMEKNVVTGEEDLIFKLNKGAACFSLVNNKVPVMLKVTTAHAAFIVKGTKFAVLTNESNTVLTIEHGKIEVENFINLKKYEVESGATYVTDGQGNDKVVQDATPLVLFNWELEVPELESMEPENILKLPGFQERVVTEEVKQEDPVEKLKSLIDEEIGNFKMLNEGMIGELDLLKENHGKAKEELLILIPSVRQDISCLKSAQGQCSLYSDKILLSRGFPRTKGTPQYRKSMAQDLEVYLKDRKEQLAAEKTRIESYEDVLKKRAEVLKTVEEKRSQVSELESLVPMLKDESLRMEK